MIYGLIRSLLFLLDPEIAHEIVSGQIRIWQQSPVILGAIRNALKVGGKPSRMWGIEFPNRFGIAAGFDKNAEMIPFLSAIGFGFVEVGTATLEPQAGNPRPRMFRYPSRRALINRMGFNNDGAPRVAERIRQLRTRTETSGETLPPLFVNLGKNKETPLADAPRAYQLSYRLLAPDADGVVVNVSSPNTPSLRDLQGTDHLGDILRLLRSEREGLSFRSAGTHPILVKLAPDLTNEQVVEVADLCRDLADGIVATNTTIDHSLLGFDPGESGGLSGQPLFERSCEVLERLREAVGPGYPLIGVGGIQTGEQARAKLEAGADLIQAYTGFVYEGPGFPRAIVRSIDRATA